MNDLINDLGETVKEYSFPLILQFPHRIHAFYVTDETDYKPSVTHKVLPLHNLTILLQGRGHRRETWLQVVLLKSAEKALTHHLPL